MNFHCGHIIYIARKRHSIPCQRRIPLKSRIVFLSRFVLFCRTAAKIIREDKISVYAAQASFFVITSAVPFLSLLFALAGIFLPESAVLEQLSDVLPSVIEELQNAPNVSLLSISAVTTLWTASRGIAAIRAGIESVYRASHLEGFFKRRFRSILSTLMFIVMIVAVVALLLFGDFVSRHIGWFGNAFFDLRTPLFVTAMTVIFTAVYHSVAKRSTYVRHSVPAHVPGALFSSAGWILFSFFYSYYIDHFPRASTIYGSLAAICLIMLWLYFCMTILMLGAVVNKLWFAGTEEITCDESSQRTNRRRS